MWEDPIVQEVREIRKELSARFNFDVHAIFEDLRKKQTATGSKLMRNKLCKNVDQTLLANQDSATPHPGR